MRSCQLSFLKSSVRSGWLCGLVLVLVGCNSYRTERDLEDDPNVTFEVPIIGLTPPRLMMEHRPYETFQYTSDLIEALAVDHQIPVIAPWEYDPWGELSNRNTTYDILLTMTDQIPVEIQNMVLLDFQIEEVTTQRAVRESLSMGGRAYEVVESEVIITLTLREYPTRTELGSVSVSFTDEPFGDDSTIENPRPRLREGIREAVDGLADFLERAWFEERLGRPPEIEFLYNPIHMFWYGQGENEPLDADFQHMDDIDRLANRYAYYRYFCPDITMTTVELFDQSMPGLLVETVGEDDIRWGLQTGDYITTIDGLPIFGPQSFTRPFLQGTPGDPITFTVERDGQSLQLEIPVLEPE